jgi:tellurium resistance protein TerZ
MRAAAANDIPCRRELPSAAYLHTIVAGLRWEASRAKEEADLDLCCALLGRHGNILELVHPRRTRSSNGSVVHSGDCRTPGGTWDRERLFVFLPMLPSAVTEIVFIAASASGHPLADVREAYCHVSDHVTEQEHLRVRLRGRRLQSACCAASIERIAGVWQLVSGARFDSYSRTALEMLAVTARSKLCRS